MGEPLERRIEGQQPGQPPRYLTDSIDSISRGRLRREARSAGPQRLSRSRLFMTRAASIRRDAVSRCPCTHSVLPGPSFG